MRQIRLILVIAAAALATVAIGALRLARPAPARALTPDLNMDMLSIPEFALTSQDDAPVTRADLLGRVTILDFFFTSCPFICPPMSRNMKRCQDALAGTGVRFLSMSVDPAHDNPERLRAYADEVGADTDSWTFATGDRAIVSRILTDGLLLAAPVEDPRQKITLETGATTPNILHPSRFILIGPHAEVISLTNGLNREQVDALIARARAAAHELN